MLFSCLVFSGPLQLFCLWCRGNLLPLHEVCPPLHFCPVYYHPHGAGWGLAERIGNVVRDAAHGAGFPWQHYLPKQARGGVWQLLSPSLSSHLLSSLLGGGDAVYVLSRDHSSSSFLPFLLALPPSLTLSFNACLPSNLPSPLSLSPSLSSRLPPSLPPSLALSPPASSPPRHWTS